MNHHSCRPSAKARWDTWVPTGCPSDGPPPMSILPPAVFPELPPVSVVMPKLCNLATPRDTSQQPLQYEVAPDAIAYFQWSFAEQVAAGISTLNSRGIVPTITEHWTCSRINGPWLLCFQQQMFPGINKGWLWTLGSIQMRLTMDRSGPL